MITFKNKKTNNWYEWCVNEVKGIACLAIALFLGISLYTYSAYDECLFYFSSTPQPIANWCGYLGAQASSILVYFFGIASYAIALFFSFLAYIYCAQKPLLYHWERVVAGGALVFVLSGLAAVYGIEGFEYCVAGGFIGHQICTLLCASLDKMGAVLLLNSFFLMGLILVTRCSLFTMAHKLYHTIAYCWSRGIKPAVIACYAYAIKPLRANTSDQYVRASHDHAKSIDIDIIEHHAPESELTTIKASSKIDNEIRVASSSPKGVAYNLSAPDEDTAKIVADYMRPSIEIFTLAKNDQHESALLTELEKSAKILQEKLERFGVQGRVVAIKRGPVVTLFEYQPAIDSKISKIIALEDDLALALQAMSIRILAPIPGKSLVGFEVANKNRKNVLIAQLIRSEEYQNGKHALPLILGEDTIGASVIVDLAKMPHLLIAGSTGSGKSVALNTMLVSLLCGCTPEQLRLILIDPKRLEFAPYADIAHLLFPIITDPKKAITALKWAVQHMEERYQKMADAGARTINDYNEMHNDNPQEQFPYLVVMIDELADLMMTAGKEIEDLITRLAQMARAAGIHLMVATQRPSVDVITGLIKVNFPSRISFRVTSKTDSRTILDASGADKLLGRGDMLFLSASEGHLKRVHGAYVSDDEIAKVVSHIQKQRTVSYLDLSSSVQENSDAIDDVDEHLMKDILQFLDEIDEVSISLLQRKFRIGYNRSARIIDALENRGFVAASSGSKTRKVIRD